jgi:bifunctional UDP-N-acetylglucosamine pyrophosphorylase/glucosamine-1-phosphate N-acetyltransferase
MKSALPKVAHRILDLPIVSHVVRAVRAAGVERVVIVTGHGAEAVEALLAESGAVFARQDQRLGTGHAVMCAEESLGEADGSLLVLAGDCPLLTPETLAALIAAREAVGAACSVLTARLDDPTGYGRIVRADDGSIAGIVEDKDLAPGQRAIDEVNTSTYCFEARTLFAHLHRLEAQNAQGEYYLTDIVGLFRREGLTVVGVQAEDAEETLGINSRVQLAQAARVLRRRINEGHMLAGVTMTDPALVWIGPQVTIGRDTTIEPMTFLYGQTSVGENCTIGPGSRIVDSTVGDGCLVDSSIVVGSALPDLTRVGPSIDADAVAGRGTITCNHHEWTASTRTDVEDEA